MDLSDRARPASLKRCFKSELTGGSMQSVAVTFSVFNVLDTATVSHQFSQRRLH
jgi:hypothetical protein